jgi:hypothetical protein
MPWTSARVSSDGMREPESSESVRSVKGCAKSPFSPSTVVGTSSSERARLFCWVRFCDPVSKSLVCQVLNSSERDVRIMSLTFKPFPSSASSGWNLFWMLNLDFLRLIKESAGFNPLLGNCAIYSKLSSKNAVLSIYAWNRPEGDDGNKEDDDVGETAR